VHEVERWPAQEIGRYQPVDRRCGQGFGDACQRRRLRDRCSRSQDGHGASDAFRFAAEAREPKRYRTRNSLGLELLETATVLSRPGDVFDLCRVQKLVNEERVAAGHAVNAHAEARISFPRQPRSHDLAYGILTQWRRPDDLDLATRE
jgi:hypothetical protein